MREDKIRTLVWPDNEAGVAGVFVRELVGGLEGPTLLVTAGEHGVELSGPAGIDSLCRRLARLTFRGTVLAIPCLSPCNIRHRAHIHGQTYGEGYGGLADYNTYQRWPGCPDGNPADRLCDVVWRDVVSRADAVINFHAWQRSSAGCLFTDIAVAGAEALARGFGSVFNELRDGLPGALHAEVLRMGRPAALVEVAGQYRIEPDAMERVERGILNVMATLGMLDEPVIVPGPMFAIGEEYLIRAPGQGLYVPIKAMEQTVREGELLGYLLDVETGARTDIRSPADGAVWMNSRNGWGADLVCQGLHAYADAGDLLGLIKAIQPLCG